MATIGTPYSVNLAVSDGTGPYKWSATGLPPGLTMDGNGTISGTPTTAGKYAVIATICDSGGQTAMINLSLTVNEPPVIPTKPEMKQTKP